MSDKADHHTKKEEDAPYLQNCEKCMKFFTTEQAYETHLKMKHEEHDEKEGSEEEEEEGSEEEEDVERAESKNNSKKPANKNLPIRSRMLEIQRNELEDNTYTFLGELGEKNVEPISNRPEIINFTNEQKLTGQTNYSVNKVIRTPYEEPIKCSDEVPNAEIEKSKHKDFLLKLKRELEVLEAKVEDEREMW